MKIRVLKHRKNVHGSVLAIGLILATVLGLTLASYLVLAERQHRSMIRSQTWGASLALSEAGVEEGLAFVNKYVGTPTAITNWTLSPFEGWAKIGNVYSKSNMVDPSMGGYTVYVENVLDTNGLPNNTPVITSVGSALWTLSDARTAQPYYAAAGVQGVVAQNTPASVVRKVSVRTRNTPVFPVPVAAIGQINLKGNNIATDSFDSADPNHSAANGDYPIGDLSKTKDNGTIVTLSTLVDSLNVGNADIKGRVKTGPNGTVAIGSQGSVGDKAWVEGGNNGIKPGYAADDFNMGFPDAVLPSVSWSALPTAVAATINGTNYDRVFSGDANYQVSGSDLDGATYIAPGAHIILHVTSNVSLTGSEHVDVSRTNSSLTIYMSGSSFVTGGSAGINSLSKNAINFAYYGLPSNTILTLGGNAAFSGTIYAPQADFSLGGGGSTVYDFVGASVTKTVTMNGHFNFHYDENLARVGPSRGYIPTSWVEK